MELTERLIGAAMAVHRAVGPGLDEKIYENSMCIELADQQIGFSQQDEFPVFYKSHFVGKLIPDLIADSKVILELKVADSITDTHIAQALSYLAITGLQVALIFNFKNASLQFKRGVNNINPRIEPDSRAPLLNRPEVSNSQDLNP
jgi:GxxExxY protein